jgi:hypothetical protein
MLDLRLFKKYYFISFPSIRILPAQESIMPRRQLITVVLPAPVLPTIPIFYPLFILNEMAFKTGGN